MMKECFQTEDWRSDGANRCATLARSAREGTGENNGARPFVIGHLVLYVNMKRGGYCIWGAIGRPYSVRV